MPESPSASASASIDSSIAAKVEKSASRGENEMECKLCLNTYPKDFFYRLENCGCYACVECMTGYVETMVNEGRVLRIRCPVGSESCTGAYLTTVEIRDLLNETMYTKYLDYKYLREVEADPTKTFCPKAGCDNVCQLVELSPEFERKILSRMPLPVDAWQIRRNATAINCTKCQFVFCSVCKTNWHEALNCEEANARLRPEERCVIYYVPVPSAARSDTASRKSVQSQASVVESDLPKFIDLISEDSESLDDDGITTKPCPVCALPIERDLGCAKIQCARCNHLFCWHCLELLDEDFLWMHFESGPCKDKLGVSRAQVHSYRFTAVLTMAGLGLLILVASPAIIIAGPCLLCYKFGPREKNRFPDDKTSTSSASVEETQAAESLVSDGDAATSSGEQANPQTSTTKEKSNSHRRDDPSCSRKPTDPIFSFCRIF